MKIYKLLFFCSLIMSIIISISAYSWMSMWMGLEMNMLSIIPLMGNKNLLSSETSIKYFLIQAMASTILMASIISLSFNKIPLILLIFNFSLFMKMGAAPFHFWFPEVMEGLSWMNCAILMTLQKITPMILLILNSPMLISMMIMSSMFISGVMGFTQTSLRKILAYSSINHIGWMLASLLIIKSLWNLYFLVYTLICMNLVVFFNKFKMFYMKHVISFSKMPMLKILLLMNFMSMGGLPPFLGFFPKWEVIQALIMNNSIFLSMLMVMLTLLTLYFYIRLMLPSIMLHSYESINPLKNKNLFWMMTFNLMSLLGLIMMTLMINLN